jgi:UDP-N-acetyl-2-amino-2-deoxyglucuronate dehydrogenase
MALRERVRADTKKRHLVRLTYITARGGWYHVSWKGRADRSGGIVTNIGIHFFDLLVWLFGPASQSVVHLRDDQRAAGILELQRADVQWFLSTDVADLPFAPQPGVKTTFRSITVDGEEIEFSEGFTDLHTRLYEEILAGGGFGIADARPSVELTSRIREADVRPPSADAHPKVAGRG